MGSIDAEERTYPLKKPPGHKAPVTRWTLKFPPETSHVYTLYIGVQCHCDDDTIRNEAEDAIKALLDEDDIRPPAIDTFRVTDGFDVKETRVWVAYWTNESNFQLALQALSPMKLWQGFGPEKNKIGIWIEHFTAPISRLETNYARLDHKPGLAQLPDTHQPQHDRTAYWGAGRDRVPASAHDLFSTPENIKVPEEKPSGFGERLTGINYDNMCHIRSGQWWELCEEEERTSYEEGLQGTLMQGMRFLWDNAEKTGTIGLRFLQNIDEEGNLLKETCGAGFQRNWADLEKWSSRHPSHLAIYNGMMAHAKKFGDGRKLMTWHEVWIFKAGEVKFEYVNCSPDTGVIGRVDLERTSLA